MFNNYMLGISLKAIPRTIIEALDAHLWRLALMLFIICGILGYFFTPYGGLTTGGDRARFATTESLVERHTFAIDDSQGLNTVDKVYIKGHFYGCQTPLMPLLMSLFYYPLYLMGITFSNHERLVVWIITLIFSGGSLVGSALLMAKIGKIEIKSGRESAKFALLFFFCTLYLSYSVILNNHIFSGFLIFLGYYLVVYRAKAGNIFLSGLCLATAAVTDPPAGIAFTLGLFTYLIIVHGNFFWAIIYIVACLPPAIIHSLANYSISGTIFPVNISPSFFKYTGAVFDESNLSGVVANTTFKELAVYGFNCFFGPRGFFSYTPLLVFSVWGLIYALKKRDSWKKAFLILLTIVFILTFYIWRTKNYGGYSYGIRFFLAFLPPIFLMLIYIVDRVKKGMLLILYRFSIVWSCLFAAVGVLKPASDSALGWNSFAANLFHFQLLKFPSVTSRTWKIIAGLSGNRPEITSYIGTLMFNLDLLDPAEEALLFSMKKRELPLTYESLGNVYYAKGNYQQALYYYHTAYQRWSNPQVLYFLGQTYAEIGQQDSSIYYFVRLISDGDAISRNAPPALSKASLEFYHKYERDLAVANIANNYMIKGELDSAQIYLRQIVHQGTEIVKVVAARAKYLILTGKEASAIQYLENAFQQRPGLYQSLKRDEALYNAVEKAHSNLTSLRK